MSSQRESTPKTLPAGWMFLDRRRTDGFTIRWRRGESLAYVLSGQRVGDHGMAARATWARARST
jgi:hypothetical protein